MELKNHSPNVIFEKDRGYNLHSNTNAWDGLASTCQGDATLGLETNYDGANNVVHYEVGKSYRLAWPGKFNSKTMKIKVRKLLNFRFPCCPEITPFAWRYFFQN